MFPLFCCQSLRKTLRVICLLAALALTIASSSGQQSASSTSIQVVTPGDLKKEADSAPAPVAGLYRFLASPADKVTLADGTEFWVAPLPQFLGARPAFAGTFEFTVVAGQHAGNKKEVAGADLTSLTPFEQFALVKITEFLAKSSAETGELSSLTKLKAAERGLQALAWFHNGTRSHPAAGVSPWQETHDRVYKQLKHVRADQLRLVSDTAKKDNHWQLALSFAERLATIYPDDGFIGRQLREFWTDYGLGRLNQNDYASARKVMARMQRQYVRHAEAKPLEEKLRQRAVSLVEEAGNLPDREAQEKLAEALSLWPRLAGAHDAILARRKQYAVLYVGVRRLPEFLSPATAWTNAEKQAVELLFEGLFQPFHRSGLGQRYEPRLAERLPKAEPLQRHLDLRRDAYWSDGERVTSADVRHTVQLLLDSQPGWRELIQVPRVEQESFTVDLGLNQGYFDPLALLGLKILPQNYGGKTLLRADEPDFGKAPVGSGPYRYAGRKNENGRSIAVFSANPQYIRAPQPALREIRMFAWQEPGKDLKTSGDHPALLIDVPTEQLAAIKKRGLGEVRSVLERRVYFLAVNHRVAALGDADLRRALAHAIDRETILDNHFRGGVPAARALEALAPALASPFLAEKHPEFHQPLNGLYPADSWAFCPPPRVPASLYDAGRAKALFRAVRMPAALKLTLKYPDDDPRVGAACKAVSKQVVALAAAAGVKIQLQPIALPPHILKQAVAQHDYDLAYYHLDYENEGYWIWPMFDPHADALRKGGANFLGYENDAKLQSLFRAAMSHREFSAMRERTHAIHAHLASRMPVIPLWQLHRHTVVPPHLDPGYIEPLRIFGHIGDWKITP
jgi:ABC-type oligopeptide transport system substrate-binding subunit